MSTATITTKGQITIPKNIRQALNLRAGDQVIFHVEGEQAVLVPIRSRSLLQLRGALSATRPFVDHQVIRDEIGRERGSELATEEGT